MSRPFLFRTDVEKKLWDGDGSRGLFEARVLSSPVHNSVTLTLFLVGQISSCTGDVIGQVIELAWLITVRAGEPFSKGNPVKEMINVKSRSGG